MRRLPETLFNTYTGMHARILGQKRTDRPPSPKKERDKKKKKSAVFGNIYICSPKLQILLEAASYIHHPFDYSATIQTAHTHTHTHTVVYQGRWSGAWPAQPIVVKLGGDFLGHESERVALRSKALGGRGGGNDMNLTASLFVLYLRGLIVSQPSQVQISMGLSPRSLSLSKASARLLRLSVRGTGNKEIFRYQLSVNRYSLFVEKVSFINVFQHDLCRRHWRLI